LKETIMETGSASDSVHLRDYLRVIFRRKRLTAATFLLIVAPAAIASYVATPTYEGRAKLVIERQNPRAVSMQDPSPGDPNPEFFQTQVQIIHSRPLAASVINALELTKKKPGLAQASDPPTAWLESSVRVVPVTNTRLIEISVTDSNPELAAAGANALAQAYVAYSLEQRQDASRQAAEWLAPHVRALEAKATESQLALQKSREEADLVSLGEKKTLAQRKLEELNLAYVAIQPKRLEAEARLAELKKAGSDPNLIGAASPNDPVIQKLKNDLAELNARHAQLLRVYTPIYPEVVQVATQIQEMKQRIRDEIAGVALSAQSELNVLRAREASLLAAVNRHRDEAQALEMKRAQHDTLAREAQTNLELYDTLLKRAKENGLAQGSEVNNARVMEEAVVPDVPIRPNVRLNMATAIVLGLALAPALAFFVEYMDDTVQTPEQAEGSLGAPVFGRIPSL
jgi:polysaccharide biosynthesis transport protein